MEGRIGRGSICTEKTRILERTESVVGNPKLIVCRLMTQKGYCVKVDTESNSIASEYSVEFGQTGSIVKIYVTDEHREIVSRVLDSDERKVLSLAHKGDFIDGPWLIDIINSCRACDINTKYRILAFAYKRRSARLKAGGRVIGARSFEQKVRELEKDGYSPLNSEEIEIILGKVVKREIRKWKKETKTKP